MIFIFINIKTRLTSPHFKCIKIDNLINLKHHKKDFGLDVAWTFSAAGHGKGPWDKIGAAVKATATRASLYGNPDVQFRDAIDFWSFTFDQNDRFDPNESRPIESYFLTRERIKTLLKANLRLRWQTLTANSTFRIHKSEVRND